MGEGHGNMSKSELGSTEAPGRNVRAKSGLNKSGHAHGACELSGAVIPQAAGTHRSDSSRLYAGASPAGSFRRSFRADADGICRAGDRFRPRMSRHTIGDIIRPSARGRLPARNQLPTATVTVSDPRSIEVTFSDPKLQSPKGDFFRPTRFPRIVTNSDLPTGRRKSDVFRPGAPVRKGDTTRRARGSDGDKFRPVGVLRSDIFRPEVRSPAPPFAFVIRAKSDVFRPKALSVL